MRLIDADALQEHLSSKKRSAFEEDYVLIGERKSWYREGFSDALLTAKSMVHSAKTIEAAPITHALWVDCTEDGGYWECSNCKEPWLLMEGTPKENKMNYCPKCGARMDMEG